MLFRTTSTTQETFLVVESKLNNRTGMIVAKEEGGLDKSWGGEQRRHISGSV